MEKDNISITVRLHCDAVIAISITQYEVDHWGATETRSAKALSRINYHDSTHPHLHVGATSGLRLASPIIISGPTISIL